MQSLKKKFPKNASDICIHAYLIHITGVIDWESFGVFLDLYDWNKLTLANIDKVSLQNPNAREHLLGTWVLSNSLYVYGEEYENEGEEWNGAYTPKDTGGISQPIDTKNAELGIKSINGKRYISKPFRYMTKLMGGNLNNMTKKNLQKLD